jgi:hypothetical protein
MGPDTGSGKIANYLFTDGTGRREFIVGCADFFENAVKNKFYGASVAVNTKNGGTVHAELLFELSLGSGEYGWDKTPSVPSLFCEICPLENTDEEVYASLSDMLLQTHLTGLREKTRPVLPINGISQPSADQVLFLSGPDGGYAMLESDPICLYINREPLDKLLPSKQKAAILAAVAGQFASFAIYAGKSYLELAKENDRKIAEFYGIGTKNTEKLK